MNTKSIKKTILVFCSGCIAATATVGLVSCNDYLTIYPTNKTIGKDFWKTKGQVMEMLAGAYKQMISADAAERAIMWGSFRSDEVIQSENYTNNDMEYINAVNLYPTQKICQWDIFYSVISRCNQVLAHAPEVVELDPEFTEGDCEVVCGQMLALRSLAYFYLVRAFRDVPYVAEAIEGDEQVEELPQVPPYEVLQHCIDDLQEAQGLVMKSGAYNDWRDFGYITQDACKAILADIYLWRASMTGSQEDYQKVVDTAQEIYQSKDQVFKSSADSRLDQVDFSDKYHLYKWNENGIGFTPHYYIFVKGNSRESILEFQYTQNDGNGTLASYLFRDGNASENSRLMASQIFNQVSTDGANSVTASKAFFSENDYRFWAYLYDLNDEKLTELNIRKYATLEGELPLKLSGTGDRWADGNMRSANNFNVNWIVYRLTDVMLMEAEARVQLATDTLNDPQLGQAFSLVRAVNKRSMSERARDTLDIASFPTRADMEMLVLSERQRELCFESKRWFDLMRFGYRHMEGVDARTIMGDKESWPALYKPMITLASRKYVIGGDVFTLKMKSEPYLYWPIYEEEMKVNSKLKQNPAFIQAKTSERK